MSSLPADTTPPLLSLRGVGKSYAVPVLTGIDLDVRGGEVHALLGANGAGKSTLVRVLSGLTTADSGAMTLAGAPYAPASRRAAEAAGVQVVLQELNLIETLSVAENLCLAHLPRRWGLVDRRSLHARATQALTLVGLEALDPRTPAAALGVGTRQLVEIAAALARDCRLLLLDEPTAALTAHEAELLFAHVRACRDRGIAVVYISHRLDEIAGLADRVTVLRDGWVVGQGVVADMPRDVILSLMTGPASPAVPLSAPGPDSRPAGARTRAATSENGPGQWSSDSDVVDDAGIDSSATARSHDTTPPIALRAERLRSGRAVRDVNVEVRSGEIVGLWGLVGSGRTETLRAIFGADRLDDGRVSLADGRPLRLRGPHDAVRAGIGLVPEDRQADALLLGQSVRSNITLAALPGLSRASTWIDATRERRTADDIARRLGLRGPGLEHRAEALSGGNQQKAVLARWLLRDCAVLLVDEPTRGIDAGATLAIHAVLRDLAARGTALLVVSSDLQELTTLCDAIVVLSAGRVTATFARDEWTPASLMAAAFAASGVSA